jgi:hypothetical protein
MAADTLIMKCVRPFQSVFLGIDFILFVTIQADGSRRWGIWMGMAITTGPEIGFIFFKVMMTVSACNTVVRVMALMVKKNFPGGTCKHHSHGGIRDFLGVGRVAENSQNHQNYRKAVGKLQFLLGGHVTGFLSQFEHVTKSCMNIAETSMVSNIPNLFFQVFFYPDVLLPAIESKISFMINLL